jgi:pimeloyl-ACP methyl ester carboxylesterase
LGAKAVASAARWLRLPPVERVPQGRVVDLAGRGSTFVVDTGAPRDGAPTLVLLHALCCTGLLTWYPAIAPLAERYRVVTLDQRWHGQGIRSPRFRLEDCADDVAALADALELDRFVVVGYSMGSLVAQLAWRQHPDRVAGAVLAAATAAFVPPGRDPRLVAAVSRRIARVTAGTQRALRVADALPEAVGEGRWALGQFRQTYGAEIAGTAAVIARFDSTSWLREMDVPTAVVLTRRDRLVAPWRQRSLARLLPNATVYEIDSGHAACVRDTATFVPALLAACASVTNRVAPRPS